MLGKRSQKFFERFDEFRGQIAIHSANSIIIHRQTCTTKIFKEIQQHFPFPKRPKKHGHGADIQGLGAQPKQMADNTLDFRNNRSHIFRSLGYRHTNQLLHGTHVRIVIGHGTRVIQTIGMRNYLHVVQAFRQLLDTTVQITQIRNGLGHSLTIKFQHNPQHTMRARMLRPHI